MPRIRKKTTKRGTTNQREKIKHKAAETRKKNKKAAKKDTQWKSKQAKDPGIPNNFPYKDQILAEVAEERRRAAEEKERRKEERRAAKAQGAAQAESSDAEGSETAFDGVGSVDAALQRKAGKPRADAGAAADVEEEQVPVLLNRDLPTLGAVLELADVVVQVLDARDPLSYRSSHIEEAMGDKTVLYVLNKIEACPREAISSWAATLRSRHPTVIFRSASAFLSTTPEPTAKGKGKARADDAWGVDAVLAFLSQAAKKKGGDDPLVVAVVGVTNTGKSSFINSLLGKAALPTYNPSSTGTDSPTTTTHAQEVTLAIEGTQVRLIDTPGLAWQAPAGHSAEESERLRAQDILLRSRGRMERLKDPAPVVSELVARATREDLMLFYNLPAFAEGDPTAFLSGVARSHALIKKGGVPDLAGAARIVLRDWSTGTFPRYAVPPAPASAPSETAPPAEWYVKDNEILARLSMRKDLRKAAGLIRLITGKIEDRKVALDAPWRDSENSDDGESDADEDDEDEDEADGVDDDASVDLEEDSAGDDDEEDDEEEEEEDEEEEEPLPPIGKRKRGIAKASAPPPRPVKKVAFAADPKESKQARSKAGAAGSQAAARKLKQKADMPVKTKPAKAPAKKAKAAPTKIPAQKVANTASKKAVVPSGEKGEEAYDFKKFF
ncbi:uncharacterized protein FIBRA_06151 [Fibroporia radiculosa]|uniref:CP-type G domain-containing protein n=1 Tax=Fibroporia radiculosa TaxID=599839 RepID=J4GS94_9APHY|nr:uncharacterized protein FIBRA_06151 [Fibroporia radiculosa]CCM03995.1 predicted protein [Fibroporia radiculosa]